MTTFHIRKDLTTVYAITGQDDIYILDRGVRVTNMSDAISEGMGYSGNTVEIRGYLEGDLAFDSEGIDTTFVVAATGKVRGEDGIGMGDGATVLNRGDIKIDEQAIQLGEDARVENFRTINADYGVDIISGLIINHAGAKIFSNQYAVVPTNNDGFAVKFINDGIVNAQNYAYDGGQGEDTVVNRGKMTGDVTLDGGNDSFDGRGGTLNGTLIGGEGDDVLVTSSKSLHLIEYFGEGSDTVKSTVDYVLNDFVERLYLLGGKSLSGTGNASINLLVGNSGDNTLSGLASNDFLDGKSGNDKLIGGLGDEDNFTFSTGYDRDTIVDFEDNVDNIDLEDFNAITSFSDLIDNHTRDTAQGLLIFAGKDKLLVKDMTEGLLDTNDVFI